MTQSVPSEDSRAGRIARRLLRLVGPAVQAPDDTATAAEFLGLGDGVSAATDTVEKCRDQAFPDTATDMLSEWEYTLGIRSRREQTNAVRQAYCLAAVRANFGGSPQAMLAAIQTIVPAATLQETPAAGLADPREVFRYAVGLGSSYSDVETRSMVQAVCSRMQPAYTKALLVESTVFRTDDSLSLTDLDVLGS